MKKEVGLVFQRWHLRAISYIRARRPAELEARVFHEGRDTQPIAIDEMSCVMMGWKKKPEKFRRYHAHLRWLRISMPQTAMGKERGASLEACFVKITIDADIHLKMRYMDI